MPNLIIQKFLLIIYELLIYIFNLNNLNINYKDENNCETTLIRSINARNISKCEMIIYH